MKVFVAGATGAIGRPLVRQLVAAGHDVTGTTRSESRAGAIESAGAKPIVCDALDADSVLKAVADASPEVLINQLTSLPKEYKPKDPDFYVQNNLIRSKGGHNLVEAAKSAGVGRFITQSLSFMYRQEGNWVKTEDEPVEETAPDSFGDSFRSMIGHEREVLGAREFQGICLRYGFLYGPDTWYAADGTTGLEVKQRKFPVVGAGTGTFSFVHVEDAASAAARAVESSAGGIYNVVDDEPAALKDWLPVYASALGAKPPRHVPLWLAKLVAGKPTAMSAVEMRGASNARAKDQLGWKPKYASWRQGFSEVS
ncbi:MAG: NAD(P)-dependent oxidoreductase [Solirubrobacterales bacterium]|nr:NAD(P)-dependent oxidoreductase [Solirubrobacterales bacterium]